MKYLRLAVRLILVYFTKNTVFFNHSKEAHMLPVIDFVLPAAGRDAGRPKPGRDRV